MYACFQEDSTVLNRGAFLGRKPQTLMLNRLKSLVHLFLWKRNEWGLVFVSLFYNVEW